MSRRVVLIRHDDGPADDRVVTWFRARNFEPEIVRPYLGQALGSAANGVAASVVYGGPFNVFETDRHTFLNIEHRWIEECMALEVPLLGICQGAQSIAHTLGARCGPIAGEPHEFGYYEIRPSEAGKDLFPETLRVTQSHFHEFAIPEGAVHLAGSDLFPNQAMRYGATTYGFQFHAEVTRTGFRRWQISDAGHYGKPGAQTKQEQDRLGADCDGAQHEWFMGFMDRLFGHLRA
ncbi:MAG: glutamine amidotransferase [Pseudomonadota bacterium]